MAKYSSGIGGNSSSLSPSASIFAVAASVFSLAADGGASCAWGLLSSPQAPKDKESATINNPCRHDAPSPCPSSLTCLCIMSCPYRYVYANIYVNLFFALSTYYLIYMLTQEP